MTTSTHPRLPVSLITPHSPEITVTKTTAEEKKLKSKIEKLALHIREQYTRIRELIDKLTDPTPPSPKVFCCPGHAEGEVEAKTALNGAKDLSREYTATKHHWINRSEKSPYKAGAFS